MSLRNFRYSGTPRVKFVESGNAESDAIEALIMAPDPAPRLFRPPTMHSSQLNHIQDIEAKAQQQQQQHQRSPEEEEEDEDEEDVQAGQAAASADTGQQHAYYYYYTQGDSTPPKLKEKRPGAPAETWREYNSWVLSMPQVSDDDPLIFRERDQFEYNKRTVLFDDAHPPRFKAPELSTNTVAVMYGGGGADFMPSQETDDTKLSQGRTSSTEEARAMIRDFYTYTASPKSIQEMARSISRHEPFSTMPHQLVYDLIANSIHQDRGSSFPIPERCCRIYADTSIAKCVWLFALALNRVKTSIQGGTIPCVQDLRVMHTTGLLYNIRVTGARLSRTELVLMGFLVDERDLTLEEERDIITAAQRIQPAYDINSLMCVYQCGNLAPNRSPVCRFCLSYIFVLENGEDPSEALMRELETMDKTPIKTPQSSSKRGRPSAAAAASSSSAAVYRALDLDLMENSQWPEEYDYEDEDDEEVAESATQKRKVDPTEISERYQAQEEEDDYWQPEDAESPPRDKPAAPHAKDNKFFDYSDDESGTQGHTKDELSRAEVEELALSLQAMLHTRTHHDSS
jgi:hypothetical protein